MLNISLLKSVKKCSSWYDIKSRQTIRFYSVRHYLSLKRRRTYNSKVCILYYLVISFWRFLPVNEKRTENPFFILSRKQCFKKKENIFTPKLHLILQSAGLIVKQTPYFVPNNWEILTWSIWIWKIIKK